MLDTSRPNDEHSKFVTGRRLVLSTIINTVNVASYYPKVSVNRQEEEDESRACATERWRWRWPCVVPGSWSMLLQLRPGAKPQFLASSHVASRAESQSPPRSARVQGPSLSCRPLVFDFIFVNIYVKFPVVSVARMSGEETDRVQRRQLVSVYRLF